MPIKLSFSKISTYIDCQRKYLLSYIFNLGTGSSPYMSNGSVIHKCCEDFVDWHEDDKTFENLLEYYYKLLPEIDKENLVHESIDGLVVVNPTFELKAIKSLQTFYDDFMGNEFSENKKGMGPNRGDQIRPKITLQEQWFNIVTKDGHEVRGLIDRVDLEPQGEHIVDYKSGQSRTTFKALQDPLDIKAMQLSVYALARYKETGKIPYKSSFFYLEPKKDNKNQVGEYRTAPKRSKEQLEKVEDFINEIGNEIEQKIKNDYNFTANEGSACYWCDFKNKCDILAASEISEQRNKIEIENEKPKLDIDLSDW